MKTGARALGVAESSRPDAARSTLAGAVVRADRVVDGFVVGSCAVGGTDATETVVALADRLDRADVAYLFFATPYLLVTEGLSLVPALSKSLDLATSDEQFLFFFLQYVLVSAAVSVP